MGKRGAQSFEEKIGIDKFKELLSRLDIKEIAKLYCEHHFEESEKAKCKACRRSIYRAKKRIEKASKRDKTYGAIATFEDIPEVQEFITWLSKTKGLKSWRDIVNRLKRFWGWIKEDQRLSQLQRPALWDKRHVMYLIGRIRERQIALYGEKQALRQWFSFQGNMKLLKDPLLKASRADLRSPKGVKRKIRRFTPFEFSDFIKELTPDEQFSVKVHVALKCRTKALFELTWDCVNWDDGFYGFSTVTIDVMETKTKGGTTWKHCPVNLWFSDLADQLKDRYENRKSDQIIPMTVEEYRKLFREKISSIVGRKVEPYDCRRSPSGWLRDLGLSDLAIGQYKATEGEGYGFCGSGWENPEIFYNRYGVMNPLGIYDKTKRLDITNFDGLIHKILENR